MALSASLSSLRFPLFSLLAALGIMGSAACGGVVAGDDDTSGKGNLAAQQGTNPDGSVDGSTVHPTPHDPTTSSDDPAAPPPAVTLAQALTRAQIDVLWDSYWASHGGEGAGTGGGPAPSLDPNDLFLHVSDLGVQCSSPTVELPCGGHWETSIVLPAALQKVGVYDLSTSAAGQYSILSQSASEPNSPAPGDCAYGAGSFFEGSTVEVLSIDATAVTFRLEVADSFFGSNPSGTYTALRCPQ